MKKKITTKSDEKPDPHPLLMCYTGVWLKLARENKQWGWNQLANNLRILGTSILFSPVRIIDKILYTKKIERSVVGDSPLFILGHWRSGTTFLHSILASDPRWGYLNSLQAFMPGLDLVKFNWLISFLKKRIPEKRPHDNMPRGLWVPEEEEFALTNTSVMGSYHSQWFPQNESYFRKYVLFEGITDEELERWKYQYLKLLKRIVLYTGKKDLILKNPPNTARIDVLLEMFPDARFIYIYRNPWHVYSSMFNMYHKAVAPQFLQSFSNTRIKNRIFTWYENITHKYVEQRSLIPEGHLIEVSYEDLEKDPVTLIEEIYNKLNIPDFENVRKVFENHILSVSSYHKNPFNLDQQTIDLIKERWRFSLREWKYKCP